MKKLAIALFGISTVFGTQAFAETETAAQNQAATAPVQQASAKYQCDQGKELTVSYAIDQSGMPTQAAFNEEGETKQLGLDPSQSDNTAVTFNSADGYKLTASVPTQSSPFAQAVEITDPNNETAYQDCSAVSQG